MPKVADVHVDCTTHSTITVSWSKPEECGENVITAYRILCCLNENGDGNDGKDKEDSSRDEIHDGGDQERMQEDDEVQSVEMGDKKLGAERMQKRDEEMQGDGGDAKDKGDDTNPKNDALPIQDGDDTNDASSTEQQQEVEISSPVVALQEIKIYGSEVTSATFSDLQTGANYVLEVFVVCGEQSGEGVMTEATTSTGGKL